jgi:hypothetical protein
VEGEGSIQRILSLDAIKGFAVVMIVIVHGIAFGIFTPDPKYPPEILARMSVLETILLAPVMIMANWFPIFILIAGATIAFSFIRESSKENPNYDSLARKKIVNAFALVVLGAVYQPILSHAGYTGTEEFTYSVITGFIDTGQPVPLDIPRFFDHTVFGGIGLGMIVLTLLFYIIFRRSSGIQETNRLLRLMIILEWSVILFGFLLEYIYLNTDLYPAILASSPLMYEFAMRFYGERYAMMPQFVFGFGGAIFGIIMASPIEKSEKRRLVHRFFIVRGLVYLIVYLFIMGITGFDYTGMIYHPDLTLFFHLGNLTLMNILLVYFSERYDFRPSYEQGLRRSSFLRTFGPVTMSVYCLESLFGSILRLIYIQIFGPDIFPWNRYANISYIVIVVGFWYLAIRQWRKYNYKFSFEWGIVVFMKWFGTESSRLRQKHIMKEAK